MSELEGAAPDAAGEDRSTDMPPPGDPGEALGIRPEKRSASRRRSRSKKLGAPRYETLILVGAGLTADETDEIKKEVSALVESLGGSDVSATDLGRRKLAYRIGDQTDGIYINFLFTAPPSLVAELDRALKLNEKVTRFLTTVADWSRS